MSMKTRRSGIPDPAKNDIGICTIMSVAYEVGDPDDGATIIEVKGGN